MVVFTKPEAMTSEQTRYCPGCGHGIATRLVAEAIDQLGIRETTIGVAPVGCAVFSYDYWNFDVAEAPHGRTPAVATGIKRVLPDHTVFTYQGDGDLAAIGTGEIIHSAARGERISVVFMNNGVYGMTGGQMAPTTLMGQRTKTTPLGRNAAGAGFPLKVCEMLAPLPGVVYLERVAIDSPKDVIKAKKAIVKSFQVQIAGLGFSLVEILSNCPPNWGMTPVESMKYINEVNKVEFPLGVYKEPQWNNG